MIIVEKIFSMEEALLKLEKVTTDELNVVGELVFQVWPILKESKILAGQWERNLVKTILICL